MDVVAFSVFALLLATTNESDDLAQLDAKFDKLEYSWQHSQFYREVFAECDPYQLQELAKHKNDSIANHSAWQLVRLPVLVGPDELRVVQADQRDLNWFLGFFEGRNRVAIPEWWRGVVLNSREIVIIGPTEKPIKGVCPGKPTHQPYNKPKDYSSNEWRYPKNASVNEDNGVVTYSSDENAITVPKILLDRSERNISCTFTEDMCFVAIHSDNGFAHGVACVDRKTNSVIWKNDACGCANFGGVDESWASLVATNDGRLFCFGSACCGIYVHAFDASNGKTLMQFSSNF